MLYIMRVQTIAIRKFETTQHRHYPSSKYVITFLYCNGYSITVWYNAPSLEERIVKTFYAS
jgi:hypothetical protein